jgi:hypothetical protein
MARHKGTVLQAHKVGETAATRAQLNLTKDGLIDTTGVSTCPM